MAEDYSLIRVGKFDIGITGLKAALKDAAERFTDATDETVAAFLLKRLQKSNYIPESAAENYSRAFLREYKKAQGEAWEEPDDDTLEILVIGPGCPQCDSMEQTVMTVLSELGLAGARLDHVRDVKQIAQMGIMGSPALMINKDVKCVGRVPSRDQLREWLAPYMNK